MSVDRQGPLSQKQTKPGVDTLQRPAGLNSITAHGYYHTIVLAPAFVVRCDHYVGSRTLGVSSEM